MNYLFTVFTLMLSLTVFAQNYEVGTVSYQFSDPDRGDRTIGLEVFYPTENGDIAEGEFPLIVFGHGFAMGYDAYENWWNELVPHGYIMAFPTTEGGLFTVSHGDFASDISFCVEQLKTLGEQQEELLHNHLSAKAAAIGHSMGGGASFLAAGNSANIDCLVGLAPAETDPSAIAAASNVNVPTLILSGSGDAVTPPAEHHLPIFEALPEIEKTYITIDGGAHCYFANTSFTCDFGEGAVGGNITIDRESQQAITFDLLLPYLAFHLKSDCEAGQSYADLLNSYPGISADHNFTAPENPIVVIEQDDSGNLFTETGSSFQWLLNGEEIDGATNAILSQPTAGSYELIVTNELGCTVISAVYTVTASGIELLSEAIRIFPNPSFYSARIQVPEDLKGGQLSLISSSGEVVLQQIIMETEVQLRPSSIVNGPYQLVIVKEEVVISQSLMIQH
ncbi:hypothetical protein N8482_00605 [Chitinophagales bacterium]|nr:hypothetical protein [Chitinophagales bacterium]